MSAVTPHTELYLLKCPLEADNQNQLDFATKSAQETYFKSLPKLYFEEFSYQRQDSVIRVNMHIDNLLEYNYVMYKNDNYSNKWFYAFVTNMEYINDNCTYVTIRTDYWQTWQFDLTWKRCFVEREHVADDTFGKHTVDEGLNSGEYVVSAIADYSYTSGNFVIACQTSDLPDEMLNQGSPSIANRSRIYNGLPSGCFVICFSTGSTNSYDFMYQALNGFVKWMDTLNKSDAIVSMFVIPESFLPSNYKDAIRSYESSDHSNSTDAYILNSSTTPYNVGNITIFRNQNIDGYVPVNNKCFCYPYNYLLVSNNGGSETVYHWEDFPSTGASFAAYGVINQGCDLKFIPSNYKNTSMSGGYLWSVSSQKLPTLSWNSDYYLNWQAKNGWNSVSQSIDRSAKRGAALENATEDKDILQKTGDVISSWVGYVGTVWNAITNTVTGADYQASIVPDTAKGNANSGDINYTMGKASFTSYKMCCRQEKIKIIDNYFSRFGYKVLETKVPALKSRTNWNFVKCQEVNVLANIPQPDLEAIKVIFTRGVTIWHNPSTFMDYSQSNPIVS